MKRFLHYALAVLTALSVFSCGKDDPVAEPVNDAPKDMTLSLSSLDVPVEGGSYSLTVTAPSRPTVSNPASQWVTVTDGTYSNYKITYGITVSANTAYEERTATLTVNSGSLSKTVSLKQAAAEKPVDPDPDPDPDPAAEPDKTLTNAKASDNAQKVYEFLLSRQGNHILSGVQAGGTANNNDNVNAVFSKTGKHPALAGYDYLFLQYSPTPESWSWVVNYGDISAPKEQWEKNGLVSFMWHWNVPTSKAAWDKGVNDYDFSGYNFYCDKTGFDINRALENGTWENDFILKDIDKVASYLKLLQKEGIPVLWRPLHEAAGNYNVYGKNGAWFWWGRGGAEPCKKLWKLLREKLEGEHGLDNLIWVWTLDVTEGAEADYAAWYPGNDLVDIVGVDIYANDTEAKQRQYKAAIALTGGHKMVTVSECGNIPDPVKCFNAGENWSWFLTWDLENFPLNTDNYWRSLMGMECVLSREKMPSLK